MNQIRPPYYSPESPQEPVGFPDYRVCTKCKRECAPEDFCSPGRRQCNDCIKDRKALAMRKKRSAGRVEAKP